MIPEGWTVEKLEDLASVERGKFSARPRNDPQFYGGEIPFVQTGDITAAAGRLITYSQTLNEKGLTVSRLFPKGTILVTIAANIGDVAITTFDVACPDSLVAIQVKEGTSNNWLIYALQMKKQELESVATQNAQKNINLQVLRPLEVLTPPLPEQYRIAEILNTWDQAIALTGRLITAKQSRKRVLMHQLLTGRRQFREFEGEEWQEFKLGDFLMLTLRKVSKPSTSYLALSIRSHGKGTFNRRVDDPSKVEMTELYEVKEDDLIVNITFAWEGAIALVKKSDEGCLVSHRFPTYVFDQRVALPGFFKYLMLSKRFFFELRLISPGGAGRNRVLNKKDFLNIRVKLPSVEEQGKIATVLQVCDEEIELLEQKLDALKRQKKGLMQKLLTGQVRVGEPSPPAPLPGGEGG